MHHHCATSATNRAASGIRTRACLPGRQMPFPTWRWPRRCRAGRVSTARPSDVFAETTIVDDTPARTEPGDRSARSRPPISGRSPSRSPWRETGSKWTTRFPCPPPPRLEPCPTRHSARVSTPPRRSPGSGPPALCRRSERAARPKPGARRSLIKTSPGTWARAELSSLRPVDAFGHGGGFPARCRGPVGAVRRCELSKILRAVKCAAHKQKQAQITLRLGGGIRKQNATSIGCRACRDRGAVDRLDHSHPPLRHRIRRHNQALLPGYALKFSSEVMAGHR